MKVSKKVALSIAGSDPSSGAGIQADLKAFNVLGLHGLTVITCLTVQNTKNVKSIHKIPSDIIESQIDVIMEDFKPVAVKTGMLYDKEIVNIVSKKIRQYKMKTIVDPIMVSTSGDLLSDSSFVESFKNDIIPISFMVTPNIQEAEILADLKIKDIKKAKEACKKIHSLGPNYVLLKGGHLEGEYAVDVLFDGEKFYIFSLPKIPNKKAHGSGCTFSALITSLIASGLTPIESVDKSKKILWSMIFEGYQPGRGSDVLNHSCEVIRNIPPLFPTDEHFNVWLELKNSLNKLLTFLPIQYVPEVGTNFGFALNYAKKPEDVCAINGRIIKTKEGPLRCGSISFGASKHVSTIILATVSYDQSYRCALNLKYSEKNIEKCKKAGLKIGSFNRMKEPKTIKSTMEWGTKEAIKELGFIPDVIYDTGVKGKEPMIRFLGQNPTDVVNKVYKVMKS